jgi:hypothetical protein
LILYVKPHESSIWDKFSNQFSSHPISLLFSQIHFLK